MWPLILLAVLAAAVIIYLVVRSRRVMSPEKFVEAVRQKFESDYPHITIKEVDRFQWVFTIDGEDHTVFFDNTYAHYRIYPEHFDDIVDNFIKSITSVEDEDLVWEEAKPRLFPALKSQDTAGFRYGTQHVFCKKVST